MIGAPAGATASHGVGRKPGDGKAQYQHTAWPSVAPAGAPFYFAVFRGLRLLGATSASRSTPTQVAGLPPAIVLTPLGANYTFAYGSPNSNLLPLQYV